MIIIVLVTGVLGQGFWGRLFGQHALTYARQVGSKKGRIKGLPGTSRHRGVCWRQGDFARGMANACRPAVSAILRVGGPSAWGGRCLTQGRLNEAAGGRRFA